MRKVTRIWNKPHTEKRKPRMKDAVLPPRLEKIFEEVTDELGTRAEDIVENVMRQNLDNWPCWLIGVCRTEHYSLEDREGIDYLFLLDEGAMKIQIKSSHRGRRDFEKKGNGSIKVIVIDILKSDREIYGDIISIIWKLRRRKYFIAGRP